MLTSSPPAREARERYRAVARGCPPAIQGRPFSIASRLARGLTEASYGVLDEWLRATYGRLAIS
jgi:hypothetical protein